MQSSTSTTLPRNYASTHLRAAYPGTCFDFSELMSFATLHPVDSFDLDAEECPSSTPCSEAEDDNDNADEAPLELTYSGGTSKSGSTSTSSMSGSRMGMATMTRGEQDDVIERVIRKLEGYELGEKTRRNKDERKGGIDGGSRDMLGGIGGMGMELRAGVVSEQDCMLWTRVWGSATAVRNARERRGRRGGRKRGLSGLGFEV